MRNIYLAKEYNNSTNVLFWMEDDVASFRNDLYEEDNYILVTKGKRVPKTIRPCEVNGHRCFNVKGDNGKVYKVYAEDHSARELTCQR